MELPDVSHHATQSGFSFIVLLLLLLVGCGGGSTSTGVCATCAAGVITGQAASGAPFTEATVSVFDSTGTETEGTISSAGNYTVNAGGITAPFIIRVQGYVDGNPVVLHAPALADDFGNVVNVTPLTELMTSYLLGAEPETQIEARTVNYSKITTASVAAAESSVKALVKDVLKAADVTDAVDLRTTEFTPDHTGLDRTS